MENFDTKNLISKILNLNKNSAPENNKISGANPKVLPDVDAGANDLDFELVTKTNSAMSLKREIYWTEELGNIIPTSTPKLKQNNATQKSGRDSF